MVQEFSTQPSLFSPRLSSWFSHLTLMDGRWTENMASFFLFGTLWSWSLHLFMSEYLLFFNPIFFYIIMWVNSYIFLNICTFSEPIFLAISTLWNVKAIISSIVMRVKKRMITSINYKKNMVLHQNCFFFDIWIKQFDLQ